MKIGFEGKKVLVAGGSRGIGRAIALGFAAAGADVSICARAILWPGVTVVPDLRDDPRFAGNSYANSSGSPIPRP